MRGESRNISRCAPAALFWSMETRKEANCFVYTCNTVIHLALDQSKLSTSHVTYFLTKFVLIDKNVGGFHFDKNWPKYSLSLGLYSTCICLVIRLDRLIQLTNGFICIHQYSIVVHFKDNQPTEHQVCDCQLSSNQSTNQPTNQTTNLSSHWNT
jgi:hypothetical protein